MKKNGLTLLVLVAVLSLFSVSSARAESTVFVPLVQEGIDVERAALVALYNSTEGDQWTWNGGWLSTKIHHCLWYGITCDDEDRVVIIDLIDNGLKGPIPREFGELAHLDTLVLNFNHVTSLPAEFGDLASLRYLSLWRNDLDSLPPEFGHLVALENLYLDENQLDSLPIEFGDLDLLVLDLSQNSLRSLPAQFGNLSDLRFLWLDDNSLRVLPAEIVNLDKLIYIDLNPNPIMCLPTDLWLWFHAIQTHWPPSYPECTLSAE